MNRKQIAGMICLMLLTILSVAGAGVGPETARKLTDQASASLVAVQYNWESEMGVRPMIGIGTVVSEDGLVMTPIALFDMRIPDEQIRDVKIVIPHQDAEHEYLDAQIVGRDETTNLAFVRSAKPRKWTAIKFEDVAVQIGQPVVSVGLLPQLAAYRAYFAEASVAVSLKGEIPQVLTTGGNLAAVGSPVFDLQGRAIGLVNQQMDQMFLLNGGPNPMAAQITPPHFFVPAGDFLLRLQAVIAQGAVPRIPWTGIIQMRGARPEVADLFKLRGQPIAEVVDVAPNSPAGRAGLKIGQMIVKVNGQPLERGDTADEVPALMRRSLVRMPIGGKVTFTVSTGPGLPPAEIAVTLEEQPRRINQAKRYYAKDTGFSVRETLFADGYRRKMPDAPKGVAVALIRPQSSAESSGLKPDDLVVRLNNTAITKLADFVQAYEDFRKASPAESFSLTVLREGTKESVVRIEPPR